MSSTLLRSLLWLTISLAGVATALAANTDRHTPAPAVAVAPPPHAVALAPGKDDNPTVAPGLVKWHKTLADAQAASEKSGRPVLLFHMMGQLDKQFC